jgi:arsenate reductase (thioredoxin)
MMKAPIKVLFLCTGNSARSILGEYLLRKLQPSRFQTFSAGANPTGKVNPLVIRSLKENFQIDASDARSKSWEEFKDVKFDLVITVCDHAREACPVWPGQPLMAHWESPDPAYFQGVEDEKLKRIREVAVQIQKRLELFCTLPLEKLERSKIESEMMTIAKQTVLP